MRLSAACEIEFQSDIYVAAILMLRPRSGAGQWVSHEEYSFVPRVPVSEYTDTFGNLCQRVVVPPGTTRLAARCTVDTPDTVDVDYGAWFVLPEFLPDAVLQFLLPSRYCPSDQVGSMAFELVSAVVPGYAQVELIRKWIHAQIEYCYGTSNSATSALDTLASRVGVCRDFAHLGIALCRSLNIPARMVVGYTHKLVVPDIHAWFEAYVGGRWYAFDATQAETIGNRVAIGYGRDAADVALVTQFGPLQLTSLKVSVIPTAE